MMNFIQTHAAGSDETAPYDVALDKTYNVGELVNEILSKRSNEWGYINIMRDKALCDSTEYRYGELLSSISETVLSFIVDKVRAAGGWSRMDYHIYVK